MPVLAQEATAESRIFNEITEILVRQRTEHVGQQLMELRSQLHALYSGPNKANVDFATCQMGLAMAEFGLGDREEALRLASNAVTIASHDMPIVANAQFMFVNMGEIALALKTAEAARQRFPGDLEAVCMSSSVFTSALDFDSAAECLEQALRLGQSGDTKAEIEKEIRFRREMSAAARSLGFSAADLSDRATCAVEALRSAGRNIYWTALRGHDPGAATLEFFVDADPDVCAELNFVVAEALIGRFEDTAVDLLTMSVRSHEGVLVPQSAKVLELAQCP
ncbi:tetratricopeptide repeat protein [Ralstonia pseudosolanacearum]|uniref:tetratricopeptide repeat protein n=1 Tax=Ralstonia pseudosolanacearum TaxID=1310165 RepID=UPI003CEAB8FD